MLDEPYNKAGRITILKMNTLNRMERLLAHNNL